MNLITYNIPAELIPQYRGRQIIVRSHDPAEIVRKLCEEENSDNVQFVQLLSPIIEPDAYEVLVNWSSYVPLDIKINNPAAEFSLLYNFSKFADYRPVRISIAVKPGFVKAVKLALALHFSVKLEIGQPDDSLIREMFEALDFYLHRASVCEPIEYFHSLFLSFYHQEPVNLWIIQEEDPEFFRFVNDKGVETVSPRLAGADLEQIRRDSLIAHIEADQASNHECNSCQFLDFCGGYFKWTDQNYDCTGVKTIFGALSAAAAALKKDVAASTARFGDPQ